MHFLSCTLTHAHTHIPPPTHTHTTHTQTHTHTPTHTHTHTTHTHTTQTRTHTPHTHTTHTHTHHTNTHTCTEIILLPLWLPFIILISCCFLIFVSTLWTLQRTTPTWPPASLSATTCCPATLERTSRMSFTGYCFPSVCHWVWCACRLVGVLSERCFLNEYICKHFIFLCILYIVSCHNDMCYVCET